MNSTISTSIAFDYPQQNSEGTTCTAQAWAKTPTHLGDSEKATVLARIKQLLIEKDAALVAHYYVDVPVKFGVAPSTQKLTTLDVSSIASDHGKQ